MHVARTYRIGQSRSVIRGVKQKVEIAFEDVGREDEPLQRSEGTKARARMKVQAKGELHST